MQKKKKTLSNHPEDFFLIYSIETHDFFLLTYASEGSIDERREHTILRQVPSKQPSVT